MARKDNIELLEGMIDDDTLFHADDDELNDLIEKPCADMTIMSPAERKKELSVPDNKQDMIDDYHYVRDVYVGTIEQGQEVLTGILEMAQQAPNPRAFEVAGQHMKIISDNADKLMKLQKEYKELNAESKGSMEQTADTIHNTNVVFNGNAEQLMDMLNGQDVVIIDEDD